MSVLTTITLPSNNCNSSNSSSNNNNNNANKLICTACQLPLEGHVIRALEGVYHVDCFRCYDCSEPVAETFFPIELENGLFRPLCEKHYFQRFDLRCDTCGEELSRGSYITAVGKKFHLEHFCCSVCQFVFSPEDSYYEHEDRVYCHYHYSLNFAMNCQGCETTILKQFVEINRNNVDEHWHPECYMIHKYWNVKLAQEFGDNTLIDFCQLNSSELKEVQNAMEDKVYRIWTVLSAFEESAAGCISDMLIQMSEGNYVEGVKMADYFVSHIEILFSAMDDLAYHFQKQFKQELAYDKEATMLCKKISSFFSLLSHTSLQQQHQQRASNDIITPASTGISMMNNDPNCFSLQQAQSRSHPFNLGNSGHKLGITQDLVSLVTGLAHYLKVLIRIGLIGTLRLEKKHDPNAVDVSRFLSQLMELANKRDQRHLQQQYEQRYDNVSSDLCQFCKKVCEQACFQYKQHYLWHRECFACSMCCMPLREDYEQTWINDTSAAIVCKKCYVADSKLQQDSGYSQGAVESVSKLKQSSFLLRVALRRLYSLLNIPDPMLVYGHQQQLPPYHLQLQPQQQEKHSYKQDQSPYPSYQIQQSQQQLPLQQQQLDGEQQLSPSTPVPQTSVNDHFKVELSSPLQQQQEQIPQTKINLTDIRRMKSTHMMRKMTNSHRVGKRSTLMETPSPNIAYVSNKIEINNYSQNEGQQQQVLDNCIEKDMNQLNISHSNPISPSHFEHNTRPYHQQYKYSKSVPEAKSFYFSELGALEHFMLKHIAVLYLEEILHDHFTLEELVELIDEHSNRRNRKNGHHGNSNSHGNSSSNGGSTLWSKFVTSLNKAAYGNQQQYTKSTGAARYYANNGTTNSVTTAPTTCATFGVPLDVLVERNGIESNLGLGPTRMIKIPVFIDEVISAMKQMDMSVEGIFRKNGNIRRLKELTEEIDRSYPGGSSSNNNNDNDSGGQPFINETPVQLAALIKKFLRELPDPLLTHKLHRLFITAQKLDSEADRKRATHLACCLLPKPNRDTMEVLFNFIKWVSEFAQDSTEGNGNGGSKMDINNLATVLAPNILYSSSKDPVQDESFFAIETVILLLKNADIFATVPEDFIPLLQNLSYEDNSINDANGDMMEMSVKHILKKCEMVMKMKKTKSMNGPIPPQLPRQHSSPATVLTAHLPPPPPHSCSSPLTSLPLGPLTTSSTPSTPFAQQHLQHQQHHYFTSPNTKSTNHTLSSSPTSIYQQYLPPPPPPLSCSQSESVSTNEGSYFTLDSHHTSSTITVAGKVDIISPSLTSPLPAMNRSQSSTECPERYSN
ncbi:hypothetical protein BDF20DRAFT_971307 [Mycotypha africana]|uniref:uncharacterized protein n=1 Tax=Mycotypha africana TaxID=64632 RepID=UPI0023019752|nr:uncharacterized protein BDF20DRAFT_971307 [Mycotypha africana]KAI8984108.1 hypothetical protein BDF20DRAFT_971307 [Mycotypha africana]